MLKPPPTAKPFTIDVDKKLEEGQKNIRLLRTELQELGQSLQSAERACCHSTGAGKLRQALTNCDDILIKQNQTLAELQNNMMLVKLDLQKKAACIAEQYQTVLKLQGQASAKKRLGATRKTSNRIINPQGRNHSYDTYFPGHLPAKARQTAALTHGSCAHGILLYSNLPLAKNTKVVGMKMHGCCPAVAQLLGRSLRLEHVLRLYSE